MTAPAPTGSPTLATSPAVRRRTDKIGVICGLRREIACLGRPLPAHVLAFAAGGSAERAVSAASNWAESDAVGALMSFGLAGGLDPSLRSGDLVLSVRVHASGHRTFNGDADWMDRLKDRLPQARVGAIEGSSVPIGEPATKRALAGRNGAIAVDMESHGVAAAATRFAVPFVALRVIADPAEGRVPVAAIRGFGPDGSLRPLAVLARLLANPQEIVALLALARQSGRALAVLSFAVRRGILDIRP